MQAFMSIDPIVCKYITAMTASDLISRDGTFSFQWKRFLKMRVSD